MRELAFLLRSAGFSASSEELAVAGKLGYEGTVEHLLRWEHEEETAPTLTDLPPGFTGGVLEVAYLLNWWIGKMVATRFPLREKLVLFWHGHFTTSADPVFSPGLLLAQNQMLRRCCANRFGELLLEVARDPAMLIYLDAFRNHKDHPNENFARELMELFTLGVGHFGEDDVRAAARAFTGWGLDPISHDFRFYPERHDDGPRRFLGRAGCWDGEEVLAALAAHPQTARHVSARMFRFFAGASPSGAERERLAAVFTAHHGQALPVLRAIFFGHEFCARAGELDAVRSPVELFVGVCRSVGLEPEMRQLHTLHRLGELPFLPPSVAGWEGGAHWVGSGTLPERWHFLAWMAARAAERFPGNSADELALWAGQSDLTQATRAQLRALWRQTGGERRVSECLTLLWASPEGQVR